MTIYRCGTSENNMNTVRIEEYIKGHCHFLFAQENITMNRLIPYNCLYTEMNSKKRME